MNTFLDCTHLAASINSSASRLIHRSLRKLLYRTKQMNDSWSVSNNLIENDGKPIKALYKHPFSNWSGMIREIPQMTFVPRTKVGICNIVKWAKSQGKKVRATGYRHTFSDLYFDDENTVLISMLDLLDAEVIPEREFLPDLSSDLIGIEVLRVTDDGNSAFVRIGASTTNEHFRRWAIENVRLGKYSWTVPFNTILTETTFGGSNATMSHGAGIQHATLSDLVTEMEFVNANGELQVVGDKEQLKAVAGCMGLIGIVTSLTMKLDRMTYADFEPYDTPVALAIPPLDVNSVRLPESVKKKFFGSYSHRNLETAKERFYKQCQEGYYAEWFWWVFSDISFVNVWKNDGRIENAIIDYPGESSMNFQRFLSYAFNLITENTPIRSYVATKLISTFFVYANLWLSKPAVTPLINALHFRSGIQNLRIRNIELMIPIEDGDWSICQRAWWDFIVLIYEYKEKGKIPVQVTVEMRVLSGSDMLLAPENGNDKTCSIECITLNSVPDDVFSEFKQDLVDMFSKYKGKDGNYLRVRPHFAKEWNGLTVHGKSIIKYLSEINKDSIDEFKEGISEVAEVGGYTIDDLKMFSNKTLRDLGLIG